MISTPRSRVENRTVVLRFDRARRSLPPCTRPLSLMLGSEAPLAETREFGAHYLRQTTRCLYVGGRLRVSN